VKEEELALLRQQLASNPPPNSSSTLALAAVPTTDDSTTVAELKKKLSEEQGRLAQIATLFSQLRALTSPYMPGSEGEGMIEVSLYGKLKEEHEKLRKELVEERSRRETDDKIIEKLNRRIRDLIQSHNITLQQVCLFSLISIPFFFFFFFFFTYHRAGRCHCWLTT
jgi:hypothetical protein